MADTYDFIYVIHFLGTSILEPNLKWTDQITANSFYIMCIYERQTFITQLLNAKECYYFCNLNKNDNINLYTSY